MFDAYIYGIGKKEVAESGDISALPFVQSRVMPHENYWRTCEIYAHQGFAGSSYNGAISNTIPALLEALKAGCDGMETDVRETADGVAVISHDETVSGTVNGEAVTRSVGSSTLAELKEILLGTSAVYGDIYICTLEELLQVAAYTGMKILAEIKATAAVADTAKAVIRTGMQGKVTYMSDSANIWSQISAIDRKASFALVVFGYGTITDFSTYTQHLTNNNSVSIDYTASSDASPDFTNLIAAQDAGLSIDFWNFSGNTTKCLDINPKHITINSNGVIQAVDNYIASKQSN